MRTIKLTIEYDGTNYAGWQRQVGSPSVQEVLETALKKHLGHPVRLTASGRTDSGVHAMGQVASFHTESTMVAHGIGRGLLRLLPADVTVLDSVDMPHDFSARRSARMRWYRYFVSTRRVRPAVGARYITHFGHKVDLAKMRSAAELLAGDHDFSAFRANTCGAKRTRLTLLPIKITPLENHILQIDVQCRSFLQNMVRIVAGTLLAVGRGRLQNADIIRMLETGERHLEARTIAPNGLFLYRVLYEEDLVAVPIQSGRGPA